VVPLAEKIIAARGRGGPLFFPWNFFFVDPLSVLFSLFKSLERLLWIGPRTTINELLFFFFELEVKDTALLDVLTPWSVPCHNSISVPLADSFRKPFELLRLAAVKTFSCLPRQRTQKQENHLPFLSICVF